jgi:glutamate synthase domain-containing protein 2/rubrerythrin/CDGSH-type Zn-finger protein
MMARYECPVCGYVYDEEQEGGPWDALPDDWVCPGCGSEKALFKKAIAAPGVTAETARIAGSKSVKIDLEPGEYYWCACGESKSQPFCDGSHKSTAFHPLPFRIDQKQQVKLCLCKRTGTPPYCDHTHRNLDSASTPAPNESQVMPVPKNTLEEPTLELIHALARDGLEKIGHHGPMGAMGVPRPILPQWDDIQILPAQLATKPLAGEVEIGTELVIGPNARKPLRLKMPIFVSDMSFGALSEEAKTALAKGAEMAGTGIASGEGGMLPEENAANSRYLFELGSAKFGYSEALLARIQAFHFKAGQAAKTGTGGHLPGSKVKGKIAVIRGLPEGEPAISPPTFRDLTTPGDYRRFADRVRVLTGGIPIGLKMSAQHIEADIDFALEAGVDYIILDGRGGATGAAPLIFRDNISVPTIPALARARRHLNQRGRTDITLIITGGLRTPADFIKALCLGADGIAIANAAIQAIGCVAARICNTNNCPTGIATQKEELRARLNISEAAARLCRFLTASVQLMKVMARACGHTHFNHFSPTDITTWKRKMAELTGIKYAGIGWSPQVIPVQEHHQPQQENSMSTVENLRAAFTGESQANRKYLAFAAKADAEGRPQIAKLFRAAAAAETVHAHAHLRVMGGVNDTKANLKAAIAGEAYEFKEMYPAFIQQAQAEGNIKAVESFRNASNVERTHHELYSKALEALEAGKDLAAGPMYVCSDCGHTVLGRPPEECEVCGASRSKFKEVA